MRLLLVEDDERLARTLAQGLQEYGYAVDCSAEGKEALDLAELEPYDLIILDWMLPGCSGLEICRTLRQRQNQTPLLMLTARDAIEDRVRGLDSGADDYLVKPFALQELLARLRALLRRPEGTSRDPFLRAGELCLDPSTREVTLRQQAVNLTNKEYLLLEYLLRNPNRVLSREQISAHIWNYDFSAMSNVVDVYVRSLRRKLNDDGLIRTVRGAGYQLVS
ncbi:MAG: response regulator transcription factor [Candidatus Eremiobacteraeota bacterium]|nr:response regulator transcription factor [Candidatus Eremiobacteraeota bacterium]MCW5872854.1 response regulator transcription factor [Candidatus Eremiobacteraeota bacterium]